MKKEIQQKLEELAYKKTNAFCYGCYIKAPNGTCPKCHSDDLMRELEGVGVEYGVDWVVQHILESELTQIDTEAEFEESIRQCYPETIQVGWMKLDTVQVMKDQDPISWKIARDEWETNESEEGLIMSFDNESTFYRTSDIETLLEEN